MHFLDLTLPTLAENLALDEALLLEAGRPVLRVWSWPHLAVVLGAGGKLAEEIDDNACRADGIPVLRRSSGGGTVLLGPGCLLYSLIFPYEYHAELREVNASYRFILGKLASALCDLAPAIAPAGISDLASDGRKFSGNSQQRKRTHCLHHGTLLLAFDLERIPRYLQQPIRQPAYRGSRPHRDFLMNLNADGDDVTRRLRGCWNAWEVLPTSLHEKVDALVAEKYGQEEWTRRR